MKIISNFKDYYDSAQAFGIDESDRAFVRHRDPDRSEYDFAPSQSNIHKHAKRYNNKFKITLKASLIPSIRRIRSSSNTRYNSDNNVSFSWFVTGFCGKLYASLKTVRRKSSTDTLSTDHPDDPDYIEYGTHYWHSVNKIEDYLPLLLEKKYQSESDVNYIKRQAKKLIERKAEIESNADLLALFEENKTPIFTIEIYGRHAYEIDVAPILSGIGFYQVFNAWLAHQEIEMYFNSVMLPSENPSQITDSKVIRDAKGFDNRSFKKESGSKNRARNKANKRGRHD